MTRCARCRKEIRKNGYRIVIVRRMRSANAFQKVLYWAKALSVFLCAGCGRKAVGLETLFDPHKKAQAMKNAKFHEW